MSEEQLLHCSFCGRSETECRYIITSPEGACICSNCVLRSVTILLREQDEEGE